MISADEDHADSPAIDIYGLGLILYELLTLSPPFNDSRLITLLQKIQAETPKPLHRHDENIPVDLDTICQKCLRKNPVERYHSAAKLQEDLQNFIQGQQINASPPGSYEMFRAWAQHPMRIYEAGMLLIISTMGISVWMTLGIWLVMRLQAEGAKLEDLVVGCVQLICTINIPHIIGGIKIINGNRLWLYICMVICIFGFIISFCGVLGFTVAYPETYQYHPVARVLVFSMMSLLFLTQTFWLGIVTWGKHLPPAKT
jgi:hypothetical protein